MFEKYFHLTDNNTTVKKEILCGFTTFLTMVYILFANSDILSETGMPRQGVFIATALVACICTIIIALYANLPFAMAPGMGFNTMFTYAICITMGYHWKEALAVTFLAGVLHIVIILTPLRKAFVNAFPEYLRIAAGAGLGTFIAYTGVKNTGLLTFNMSADQLEWLGGRITVNGSAIVPSLIEGISATQTIAVIGLIVTLILLAFEKKTGDRYAALPMGIIIAAFVGIPLGATHLNWVSTAEVSASDGFGEIFISFFGSPGLLSIFSGPTVIIKTLLIISILLMTGLLDSVGTMIGVGQIHNAKLFDKADTDKFSRKGASSKLDKSLISNSLGNAIAPLFGSSSATIYLESVTGIAAGGRTGLTGLVVGVLFLLCLPLAGFFNIIPNEAVAPALIIAGASMLTRLRHIEWHDYEQSLPAFMTILFMPLAYSVLDGIAVGVICHVIIQTALGKRREVHPLLFIISIVYVAFKLCEKYVIYM